MNQNVLPPFIPVKVAAWLRGQGITKTYDEIKRRRLQIIKRGRSTKVVTASVLELNEAELAAACSGDVPSVNPTAPATAARMRRRAAAKAAGIAAHDQTAAADVPSANIHAADQTAAEA